MRIQEYKQISVLGDQASFMKCYMYVYVYMAAVYHKISKNEARIAPQKFMSIRLILVQESSCTCEVPICMLKCNGEKKKKKKKKKDTDISNFMCILPGDFPPRLFQTFLCLLLLLLLLLFSPYSKISNHTRDTPQNQYPYCLSQWGKVVQISRPQQDHKESIQRTGCPL